MDTCVNYDSDLEKLDPSEVFQIEIKSQNLKNYPEVSENFYDNLPYKSIIFADQNDDIL